MMDGTPSPSSRIYVSERVLIVGIVTNIFASCVTGSSFCVVYEDMVTMHAQEVTIKYSLRVSCLDESYEK